MFDETRFVSKSSASLAEPVLKRCERALPTSKLHQAPQIAAGTCAQAIHHQRATRPPPRTVNRTKSKWRTTVASARIRNTTGNVSLSQKPVDFRPNAWGKN